MVDSGLIYVLLREPASCSKIAAAGIDSEGVRVSGVAVAATATIVRRNFEIFSFSLALCRSRRDCDNREAA
jgi:hypothetical protein